jgi:hypothetical protein
MLRSHRLITTGMALAIAGTISLTGCTQTKEAATATGEAAKEAASATGQAAKDAATGAAQTALAPAVNPVLDLLKKSEADVTAGNIPAAVAAMGGFKALWDKAAPVIQPLAGDKWPAINTAANLAISTFAKGATPNAATAGSAITGLMGPLQGLLGK